MIEKVIYNKIMHAFHPLEITSETISYENRHKPILQKNLYVELKFTRCFLN